MGKGSNLRMVQFIMVILKMELKMAKVSNNIETDHLMTDSGKIIRKVDMVK